MYPKGWLEPPHLVLASYSGLAAHSKHWADWTSAVQSCHDAHQWSHHADLYIYLFMAVAASLCAVGKQPSSEPNKKGSEQILDLAIGQQPQIERLVVTSSSSYDHMGCFEMLFIFNFRITNFKLNF